MVLTDEQKRMYEGEYGPGMQKAITMLVEYGNVWDAGRLVKVHNAHVGLGGGWPTNVEPFSGKGNRQE